MQITTVKKLKNGFLVNGSISIPDVSDNSDFQKIQEWIAEGGVVEPEFTESELLQKAKDKKITEIKTLRDSKFAAPLIVRSDPDVYLKPQPQVNIFLASFAMSEGTLKEWLPCDINGNFLNQELFFTKKELMDAACHYENRKTVEYNQCNKRIRAVDKMTTIEEIENYDITTIYEI